MECPYNVKYPGCEYQIEIEVLKAEIDEIEEYVSVLINENNILNKKIEILQSDLIMIKKD